MTLKLADTSKTTCNQFPFVPANNLCWRVASQKETKKVSSGIREFYLYTTFERAVLDKSACEYII